MNVRATKLCLLPSSSVKNVSLLDKALCLARIVLRYPRRSDECVTRKRPTATSADLIVWCMRVRGIKAAFAYTRTWIHSFIHSFIHSYIPFLLAPLQFHFYSEALTTQHGYCAGVSRRSALGNCELRTCPRSLRGDFSGIRTHDPPVERRPLYQCAATSHFKKKMSNLKWKTEIRETNPKRMKKQKTDESALRAEGKPILPKASKTTRTSLIVQLSMSTFQKQWRLSQSPITNVKKLQCLYLHSLA